LKIRRTARAIALAVCVWRDCYQIGCKIISDGGSSRVCFYVQTNSIEGDSLRLVGCLLLPSGFFLVLAALVLFPAQGPRFGFVVAGLGVEVLGVGLLTRAYTLMQKKEQR